MYYPRDMFSLKSKRR